MDDPVLLARVRWTLRRLEDELVDAMASAPARLLRARADDLLAEIGPGPMIRTAGDQGGGLESAWVREAIEGMTWVAEERGLGGARALDGLAWDLPVDRLWERWVGSFANDLAPRLGLVTSAGDPLRHRLRWRGGIESMGALAPDIGLRGAGRTVWIDAKYKAHFMELARKGWGGTSAEIRESHRADLHQALAYASLGSTERVDTVLAYPCPAEEELRAPFTCADLTAGRRQIRLVLAALPFGFKGPDHRERTLEAWRGFLAA